MTTYSINCVDTERETKWMRAASKLGVTWRPPGPQDSGYCRYTVDCPDEYATALESALDADSTVISYCEVIS